MGFPGGNLISPPSSLLPPRSLPPNSSQATSRLPRLLSGCKLVPGFFRNALTMKQNRHQTLPNQWGEWLVSLPHGVINQNPIGEAQLQKAIAFCALSAFYFKDSSKDRKTYNEAEVEPTWDFPFENQYEIKICLKLMIFNRKSLLIRNHF